MKRLLKMIFAGQVVRVLLIVAILAGLLLRIVPFTTLDDLIYDQLIKLRPPVSTDRVAVVAIDAASIKEIGSWPWPRTYLADLLTTISKHEPAAVGLHLLMPEPEWNPLLSEIGSLRQDLTLETEVPSIDRSLAELAADFDGDRQLAEAIKELGRVVVPFLFLSESADQTVPVGSGVPERTLPTGYNVQTQQLDWQQTLASLHNPFRDCLQSDHPQTILTSVLSSGKQPVYQGHINYSLDTSGGVRQLSLMKAFDNQLYQAFGLQLMALADKDSSEIVQENGVLRVNGNIVPTGDDFAVYSDPVRESAIPQYSFVDVISGTLPTDTFKGKVVLIGLTEPFFTAGGTVEVSKPAPVVSSAAIVSSLLSNSHVSRPYWAFMLEAAVLLYLGLFLTLILPRLPAGLGWSLQLFFAASWLGAVASLLVLKGLWFQLAPHLVFVVAGLLLIGLQRYFLGRRDNFEDLKLLGLSFQSQGLLDTAFEKFSQCPVEEPSVKEVLYNLGLDFERKRMFNKAVAVYTHLLTGGKFKDAKKKIVELVEMEKTVVLGGAASKDATMILGKGATAPTLGRYEIVRELGQGAMGTVYLGRDPKINREVAIKTLNLNEIESAQLQDVKERFFREAEAAGRLNHPHIVTIYDAGEEHDLAYMAMEYLVGEDLSAYCSENTLLPVADVLRIAADVADALAYAHDNDVIHRDIKPSNLMLLEDGKVKVTDFGIARVVNSSQTQTGTIIGTPSYMSPEQVSGEKVKGRSDLFSLGVVCYELFSGNKPFVGDNLGALMHNIANVKYSPLKRVRPELPECCYAVVRKLLKKEFKDRYQSATEVVDALRKCIEKAG